MPIDFNPHFYTNNVHQQVIRSHYVMQQLPMNDSFVKSLDSNFEGMKIEKRNFGRVEKNGEVAMLYTITNKNGASVSLSTFGATITSLKVPDKDGKMVDVVHGYNSVTPYEKSPVGHAGGTIGPYANKINNGKFVLNGEEYTLECNKDNGTTHSHGGSEGLDVQNWKAKALMDGIEFSYLKEDMVDGYPANVRYKVIYKFGNDNKLHIQYKAKADKDTIINLTNHTYFNLDGAENTEENSVLDHIVKLNSSYITENGEKAIPTGKFLGVKDTPFDFNEPKRIGDVISQEHEQLKIGKGFDQNYCVDGYDGISVLEVAEVESPKSGIVLKVSTNLPGFQFYTANNLGKLAQPNGKDGNRYEKRSGLCIEPQVYPNAINTPEFKEKGILKKGEAYNKEIVYSFEVRE